MPSKIKINYGCGEEPLEGFINIDCVKNDITKPDLICNIKQDSLPFESNTIETITFIHSIEHIEKYHWQRVFKEFHRVLEFDGELLIAYPEFEMCAVYFIENYRGARDYFEKTLYGRQLHPGDYHVVPMRTPEVISFLRDAGFVNIKHTFEPDAEWNTFISCHKGKPFKNKEDLIRKEIFGK